MFQGFGSLSPLPSVASRTDDFPRSFREARALFDRKARGRGRVKLAHNTYLVPMYELMGGTIRGYAVELHDTRVVQFHRSGWTVLDTGGWQTFTTRDRMRRAGVAIFCSGGVAAVTIGEQSLAYRDGMRFRGTKVQGAGPAHALVVKRRRAALRKDRLDEARGITNRTHVRRLATRQFSEHIIGGNVPEAFQN